MEDYLNKVVESVSFINDRIRIVPEIAIILGSGLGALADEVTDRIEITYDEIPNFPSSNVDGHGNKLIVGRIYDKNVIVMQGRFHYYEGYEMDEVTFPIRVFALLGIKQLIVSNAAGGLDRRLKRGDLMLITDHINISGLSPLRGDNISEFGVRFPSMRNAYSPRLIELAKRIASGEEDEEQLRIARQIVNKKSILEQVEMSKHLSEMKGAIQKIPLQEGIYAYMPGPQYETEAEIKMLQIMGADAVGMSTVPEVICATHSDIEVLGISCITDECYTDVAQTHEKVVEVANKASEKLKTLVMKIIKAM